MKYYSEDNAKTMILAFESPSDYCLLDKIYHYGYSFYPFFYESSLLSVSKAIHCPNEDKYSKDDHD